MRCPTRCKSIWKKANKEPKVEKKARSNFYISKPSGEGKCPICKSKTILRHGKFGKFYGCSQFPGCKGSRNFD